MRLALQLGHDGAGLSIESLTPPHRVEGGVVRDPIQPAGGVPGNAIGWPGLQRPEKRLLHSLLGEIEVGRTEHTGEVRHDPAGLMPEQVFEQTRRVG